MRIADTMNYEQVLNNLTQNRTTMSQLQNQAATQKRVTKPSDDPIAASRVLTSRIELQGSQQYLKNLNYARSFLEFTDQSLGEMTDHLSRAKELALGQANDASSNEHSRRVVATEVRQIYEQLVQVANRKLGDRFIFGGYQTQKAPFDIQGNYAGDSGEMLIHVEKGSFVPMNIPGNKIFMGEGLSADGIIHATSKQPLDVNELKKIQAREMRLGVGAQEQKPNPMGAPQPSAIPGQPEGQVGIRGPASQNLEQPLGMQGLEPQESKGINVFDVLKKMEASLLTNDKGGVQDSLDRLDAALSQVILGRSQVGSRSMVLDNSLETLQKQKVDAQGQISNLEDADAFEVISEMNKTEGTLKATMQTSGKLIQPSLMDFIR